MAIDGTYAITATAGSKTKKGTAEISSYKDTVTVTLDAPVLGKVTASGVLKDDGSFVLSGATRVMLKRIKYTIAGRVKGDKLIAVCETNLGNAEVQGKRIA
ncbi:MAG: hypothetical protein IJ113_08285 [Eggerthellaceae bacterium]|nr:hypothetical protein [Eggerthellaceae bacterium]